jgi:hypothetical protein
MTCVGRDRRLSRVYLRLVYDARAELVRAIRRRGRRGRRDFLARAATGQRQKPYAAGAQ